MHGYTRRPKASWLVPEKNVTSRTRKMIVLLLGAAKATSVFNFRPLTPRDTLEHVQTSLMESS